MNRCLALCIGIALLASGLAAGAAELNGREAGSDQDPAGRLTFVVLDSTGAAVTSISPSDPWTYAVNGYWINFTGSAWTLAEVTVYVLNSPGLPQKVLRTSYSYPSYSAQAVATVPFAIGDWGGATYGTVQIQVRTYDGDIQTGYAVKNLDLL